ncbi:MAG: peptidyl-prolyl cis-trans isomerase [Proteobacteria bacterium]|nr:peptidyl-prolyl cis-trans isomerase [Pseudomonadota bacterium]
MLQRIGDSLHTHRWFWYVMLGALALVFAAWGAYGVVNLNVGSSSYAAEGGGAKIPLEEARNAWLREQTDWQQRLGGAEIPAQLRERLQDQVLERLITNALMTQRTGELGYRVTPAALRDAIQREPAFQISGQYSAEAAKAALSQAGISLEAYQADLSAALQRAQLQGGIRASQFLTPAEVQHLGALENEEREVRYLTLPADRFKAAVKVDDAAIAAWYKAHQAQYMTVESAHLQYAELRLDTLAAQQTVSDEDLHAAYDKQKSQFVVPERRHARHILITGKDDKAAQALAQQVLAQAKAGKDFAALARQYSRDPGSAQNGGDLGWADRGSFVAPFADALFGMSVGEIRGPVKTQYGYHIIRLDEIQPGKTRSFDEARAELASRLAHDRASDRFGEIQEQLQSKLQEPGADLAALAQQFNLQQGDIADFAKGAGATPLGVAKPIQDLVFGDPPLATGRIGGPVLLADDRLVLVKVLELRKPQPEPLAKVRDSIVAAITKEQSAKAALAAATSARERLAGGASFDAVAQDLKLTAEPAHFIGRQDPSVPAAVRDAVFATAPPAPGKPELRAIALPDGGAAVVDVTATRVARVTDQKAINERLSKEVDSRGVTDALAYTEQVRRETQVRKNPKAFE